MWVNPENDVGRCVSMVLDAVDQLPGPLPVESVLFPLLGTGHGGGDPAATGVALDRFATVPGSPVTAVHLLAYTAAASPPAGAPAAPRSLRMGFTVHAGYTELPPARFKQVDVTVKVFSAPAWLWVSRHPG